MTKHVIAALLGAALLSGCGGGGGGEEGSTPAPSSMTPATLPTISPASNVLPISVNPGPANSANLPFGSVTVCVPGSSSACQTVDGILIDTGSSGLRILASVLSAVSLPQQADALGNPVVECAQFADGFTWGPVKIADVKIAGEQAGSLPIQVIGDPAFSTIPAACSSTGRAKNTVRALAANGILGIGSLRLDCGSICAQTTSPGLYYVCPPSSACEPALRPVAEQVPNPVPKFSRNNNGVIVKLPAVPPQGSPTVDGSLIFGIGTQSNNGLGTAAVFTINATTAQFTTFYRGLTLAHSFADSGSNALFFPDPTIRACSSTTSVGFYCPVSTLSLSAVIQGANGANASIDFNVANADALLASGFTAFNNLGSPLSLSASFDWGLPFFFGRSVFVAIEGANVPGGPAGPFLAF